MKIITIKSLVLNLLIGFACQVSASTITVTSATHTGVAVRDAQEIAVSEGAIRVGFFNLQGDNAELVQSATSIEDIEHLWTPLAEGGRFGGSVEQSGNNTNILNLNDEFNERGFLGQIVDARTLPQGRKLFLWIFNDSDPSQATDWAIVSSSQVGWTMPSSIGSTTLTTSAVDEFYRGSLSNSTILLEAVVAEVEVIHSFYDAWAAANFTLDELAGSAGDENADPDGDGYPNLLEYAFGRDPLSRNSEEEFYRFVTTSSGRFALQYEPNLNREDVLIRAQTSIDLEVWNNQEVMMPSPGVFDIVIPEGVRGFARIQLVRLPVF